MSELFYRLPRNVITIFSGRYLLGQVLAVLLSIVIVTSNGDWTYFLWMHGSAYALLTRLSQPAIQIGMVMPVVACMVVSIAGLAEKNRRLITTGWALGQTVIVSYLITTCYKAFTGRPPPANFPPHFHPGPDGHVLIDGSHGFQFGFLKGSLFWGWPSGHATLAFSMAVCLITLYPKSRTLVFLTLLYAFYIGLGISVNIHWFSESVAGAIIGSVIGAVVGKSFRNKLVKSRRKRSFINGFHFGEPENVSQKEPPLSELSQRDSQISPD